MGASYYIHNVIGKINVGSNYGKEVIERQLTYQQQRLSSVQNKIRNKYSDLFNDANDYTDLAENLEQTLKSALLPELSKNLPVISFSGVRQGIIKANKNGDIGDLQKAIDKMKADISQYEKLYERCEAVANKKRGKKWISEQQLNTLYKDKERIRGAKDQLEKILTADGSAKWGLSNAASRTISTVAGLMAEYSLTDLLNTKFLKNGKYSLGNGFQLQISQVGAQSGKNEAKKGYSTGTADIQISVTNSKGIVVLNLPSISLKRTSSGASNKMPKYNIHIKTTKVGKLIELGEFVQQGFDLGLFYNAYANHKRRTHTMPGGEPVYNEVTNINQMYRSFHTAALLTSLTGSLDTTDFAYYLVINDKLFTADEILLMAMGGKAQIGAGHLINASKSKADSILGGNSAEATSLSRAQQHVANYHSKLFESLKDPDIAESIESQTRSNEIQKIINNLTLTLNLNIQLSDLI